MSKICKICKLQLIPQNVNVPANSLCLGDNIIEIWSFLKGSKKVKKRSKVGSIFRVDLLTRPNPRGSTLGHPSHKKILQKIGL